MSEKRFWSEDSCVGYYTEIVDNEKELKDVPNPKKNLTIEEVVNLMNNLNDENQGLKKALLFFVDVANSQCSSNWRKDMENDCQKLFNCSYEEAKEKYGDYDCTWWELGG